MIRTGIRIWNVSRFKRNMIVIKRIDSFLIDSINIRLQIQWVTRYVASNVVLTKLFKRRLTKIRQKQWQKTRIIKKIKQSDRWEGKWEKNLFPSYIRDGKSRKIFSLFTWEKRKWKKSLLSCEKERETLLLFFFLLFLHLLHIILRISTSLE